MTGCEENLTQKRSRQISSQRTVACGPWVHEDNIARVSTKLGVEQVTVVPVAIAVLGFSDLEVKERVPVLLAAKHVTLS